MSVKIFNYTDLFPKIRGTWRFNGLIVKLSINVTVSLLKDEIVS